MQIASSAFENNGSIPIKYTCDGENINPPLHFIDVPLNAKSLVLFMDDPDVPKYLKADGIFDHWVLYNIAPNTLEIPEGQNPRCQIGLNSRNEKKYTGPCPPDREHRYFFKLYALDNVLEIENDPTKSIIEQYMEGHILAKAILVGRYNKQK